jgi:hypothetical protein
VEDKMICNYGNTGGGIFLMWITYLLFIGLLAAAIYWLIKSANQKNQNGFLADSKLEKIHKNFEHRKK